MRALTAIFLLYALNGYPAVLPAKKHWSWQPL